MHFWRINSWQSTNAEVGVCVGGGLMTIDHEEWKENISEETESIWERKEDSILFETSWEVEEKEAEEEAVS